MRVIVRMLVLTTFAAVMVAGCSVLGVGQSESTCSKDRERGMPCASVDEVYKKTNGPNWKAQLQENDGRKGQAAPAPQRPASVLPIGSPQWPTPVLEPAQVMRVWIAPWVDDQKSLHWPSYVFTEVTPRTWSYGKADFRQARQLTPLQIDHRPEPTNEGQATASTNPSRTGGSQ